MSFGLIIAPAHIQAQQAAGDHYQFIRPQEADPTVKAAVGKGDGEETLCF
jgi:hypothetical protein